MRVIEQTTSERGVAQSKKRGRKRSEEEEEDCCPPPPSSIELREIKGVRYILTSTHGKQ
jgi:hypothetical protein